MEEKYQLALNKIIKLAKKNPEFGDALREALGVNDSKKDSLSNVDSGKVDKIESYLGLDKKVDDQDSTIDYSFIDDEFVLQKLVSDNREMMRFRYGTRYHEIDFLEYCRFALFQIEMLLNYFYSYNGVTLEEIKTRLQKYYPNFNSQGATTLSAIPCLAKIAAYSKEFSLNYATTRNLQNVRQIRNDQSHRSVVKETFSIEKYQNKLIKMQMPLMNNGEVNYFKIQEQADLLSMYESKIYNTKAYNTYCYYLWCERKPFEDIFNTLRDLANSMANNLA